MNDNIKKMFEEISAPEFKQEQIRKHQEYLENISMDYQLGYFVGESIVPNLPTLSIDALQSKKVIKVSEEETNENERLYQEWYTTTRHEKNWDGQSVSGDEQKWEKYYQHNKMLEQKYLPPVFEWGFRLIRINDMDEFKKGLRLSLWDCDMCSYDIEPENIQIENDIEYGFTEFKFKLRNE